MAAASSRTRDKFLHIAVTEEEHVMAERVASQLGVSLSSAVRMLIRSAARKIKEPPTRKRRAA